MAFETISPNMGLPVPGVGLTTGPQWATDLDNCLALIDQHDHTPGHGVQITPSGLNINTALNFQNNSAINLSIAQFTTQLAQPNSLTSLYSFDINGDLYWNDGAGNKIQITASGGVVGAPGNIINLLPPASVTYFPGTQTLVFLANGSGTPMTLDAGSIIIRDLNTPFNGVTLGVQSPLTAPYNLFLPPAGTGGIPVSQESFVTIDTSNQLQVHWHLDNNTINAVADGPSTFKLVANTLLEYQFQANGPYRVGVFVDGIMPFNANSNIKTIWIYNLNPGVSGTTEFDLKMAAPGGSFTTILSTTGKIDSTAAADIWTDSNVVVAPQTGVVKPVVATSAIPAGSVLRFDILNVMSGASNCGVIVQYTS